MAGLTGNPAETVFWELSQGWTASNATHPVGGAAMTPKFTFEGSVAHVQPDGEEGTIRCWTVGEMVREYPDLYNAYVTRKERVRVQLRTQIYGLHLKYRTEVERLINALDATVIDARADGADASHDYYRAYVERWSDISIYPGGQVSSATVLLQMFWEDR